MPTLNFYGNKPLIKINISIISLLILIFAIFLTSCGSTQSGNSITATPGIASYSQDIAPIFDSRCAKCHGSSKQDGQLDLSSFNNLMAGGKTGQVIIPGNADGSKLILMVSSGKMPKKGAKLSKEQIQLLKDWVNAGAENN